MAKKGGRRNGHMRWHGAQFYVRRKVPKELEPVLGKSEVVAPLGTDAADVARIRRDVEIIKINAQFERARRLLRDGPVPRPGGRPGAAVPGASAGPPRLQLRPLPMMVRKVPGQVRGTGPKTTFHSFRRSFRDALREADIGRDAVLALGGWSTDGAKEIDGSGLRPSTLAEEIAKVEYPGLDLKRLHVV